MKLFCAILLILSTDLVNGACPTIPTYDNTTGNIAYPAGDKLEKGDVCTLTIKVKDPAPGFISLTLSEISLTTDGKLEIYDGDTTKPENQLFAISGSNFPEQTGITFSNSVNFKYTVGDVSKKSTWTISYASDECATEVSNPWAVMVKSPKYLFTPKKGFHCTYNVTNSLPESRLSVASTWLTVSGDNYLELTNGGQKKRFTDKAPPQDFFATDNSATVEAVFHVADASSKPSFSLLVDTLLKECSEEVEIDKTFLLKLTIPAGHAIQYKCRWLLRTKSTTARILANVTESDLIDGYDLLTFVDGSSSSSTEQIVASLGSGIIDTGYLVTTSSGSLIINLNIGNSQRERSLVIDLSEQEDGGRFSGQATLKAGKKASNADTTISAYFQLLASSGKLVNIKSVTGLSDKATLSLYDGLQTSDKLITVFTNAKSDLDSVTGKSEMLLVLEDLSATASFTAEFSSIEPDCDMLLTDASGEFSFSDTANITGTQNCTITFAPYNAPEGTMVLNFDSLTVGEDESVFVFTGLTDDTLVAEFNKELGQASEVYLSNTKFARILTMNGKDEKARSRLAGRYYVKADVCGGKLAEDSASITTPNYPNQYPLNAECTWTVDVKEKAGADTKFLFLNLKSLNLASGHYIHVDNVKEKTTEQLASYMGEELPDDLILPVTPGLRFLFSASPKNAGMKNEVAGGAQMDYRILTCGGNMSDDNGTFNSPDYSKVPTASSKCIWIIDVGVQNEINIVQFQIKLKDETITSLPSSDIKVYDGASVRSTLMNISINKTDSGQVLSLYNKVIVEYNYNFDPKTKDKAGFTLTYNTFTCNSTELCKNGICLHPDWRCNGDDDCGDNTDEKGCLTPAPTPAPVTVSPKPKPSGGSGDTSGYVKGGYVALVFFIALFLGMIIIVIVPRLYRRIRGGGRNYSRMHDSTPVVT